MKPSPLKASDPVNADISPCETRRIDEYLDGRLDESEFAELEAHLSRCPSCREAIQGKAAEPGLWLEATELLGEDSGGFSSSGSFSSSGRRSDDGDLSGTTGSRRPSDSRGRQVLSVLDSLSPTDDPEMLGRIGHYEISGVVGIGGMGAVLKGFDKSLRRVVAVKVMSPHLANSGTARTRFQREARAAAAITHENVIDTYGVAEANGLPYLVMPFARGPSLQKRIDESGPLSVVEVVRIGRQIAAGLSAAHEQGLVHRDIKPANILLNEGVERLWITDFGVARAMDDASMTQTGLIAGTPQYMSPEQARGETVDHRSDLFSLGSILYTACTGRPPFRSEAAYGILRRITDTDPKSIREINPDIPDWLCLIIDRLMQKHAGDRFQTSEEVADLLERALAHLQQPTAIDLPSCIATPANVEASLEKTTAPRPTLSNEEALEERKPRNDLSSTRKWGLLIIAPILLFAVGTIAMQLSAAADISGKWFGEGWQEVSLDSSDEASGWYTGKFTDSQGRRGVLQLDWSRLQRRFNGRWKLGEEQSGAITLRVAGTGEVRGAIVFDPDSKASADSARLRDFSWKRDGSSARGFAQVSSRSQSADENEVAVRTPVKGVVVKLGEGVKPGAIVRSGDLIAELREVETETPKQSEERLALAMRQLEAAEAMMAASNRGVEAAQASADLAASNLMSLQRIQEQVASSEDSMIASAKNKIEAEKAKLTAHEADLLAINSELIRMEEVKAKGLISAAEYEGARAKLKKSEAKATELKAGLQAMVEELAARKSEKVAKLQRGQIDVDQAAAALNEWKAKIADAELEVAKAQAESERAKKSMLELKAEIATVNRFLIRAPFDGRIIYLLNPNVSQTVKEGDIICELVPTSVNPNSSTKATETKPAQSDPTLELSNQATSRPSTTLRTKTGLPESMNGFVPAMGAASEISQRLRGSRERLESSFASLRAKQGKLVQVQKELDSLGEQLAETRESDESVVSETLQRSMSAKNAQILLLRSELQTLQHSIEMMQAALKEANAERETIVKILKTRLEAAEKRNGSQSELAKMLRAAFDAGKIGADDLLRAEQATSATDAEVQELRLLLDYYLSLDKDSDGSKESTNESTNEGRGR